MAFVFATDFVETRRTFQFGEGGASATRIGRIDGGKEIELVSALFDGVFIPNQGYQLRRATLHPDYNWMHVGDINIVPAEPDDPPASGTVYGEKKLEATISYVAENITNENDDEEPPDLLPGTSIQIEEETSAEMLALQTSGFLWDSDNSPIEADLDIGIVIPTKTIRCTWRKVRDANWDGLDDAVGRVNDKLFLRRFKAQTLLYMGWSRSRSFGDEGEEDFYTVSMTWLHKSIKRGDTGEYAGWNHFYNEKKAASGDPWDRVINATTGFDSRYNVADFDRLFRGA